MICQLYHLTAHETILGSLVVVCLPVSCSGIFMRHIIRPSIVPIIIKLYIFPINQTILRPVIVICFHINHFCTVYKIDGHQISVIVDIYDSCSICFDSRGICLYAAVMESCIFQVLILLEFVFGKIDCFTGCAGHICAGFKVICLGAVCRILGIGNLLFPDNNLVICCVRCPLGIQVCIFIKTGCCPVKGYGAGFFQIPAAEFITFSGRICRFLGRTDIGFGNKYRAGICGITVTVFTDILIEVQPVCIDDHGIQIHALGDCHGRSGHGCFCSIGCPALECTGVLLRGNDDIIGCHCAGRVTFHGNGLDRNNTAVALIVLFAPESHIVSMLNLSVHPNRRGLCHCNSSIKVNRGCPDIPSFENSIGIIGTNRQAARIGRLVTGLQVLCLNEFIVDIEFICRHGILICNRLVFFNNEIDREAVGLKAGAGESAFGCGSGYDRCFTVVIYVNNLAVIFRRHAGCCHLDFNTAVRVYFFPVQIEGNINSLDCFCFTFNCPIDCVNDSLCFNSADNHLCSFRERTVPVSNCYEDAVCAASENNRFFRGFLRFFLFFGNQLELCHISVIIGQFKLIGFNLCLVREVFVIPGPLNELIAFPGCRSNRSRQFRGFFNR